MILIKKKTKKVDKDILLKNIQINFKMNVKIETDTFI